MKCPRCHSSLCADDDDDPLFSCRTPPGPVQRIARRPARPGPPLCCSPHDDAPSRCCSGTYRHTHRSCVCLCVCVCVCAGRTALRFVSDRKARKLYRKPSKPSRKRNAFKKTSIANEKQNFFQRFLPRRSLLLRHMNIQLRAVNQFEICSTDPK